MCLLFCVKYCRVSELWQISIIETTEAEIAVLGVEGRHTEITTPASRLFPKRDGEMIIDRATDLLFCMKQRAQNAAKRARCLSSLFKENRFTAKTVSASKEVLKRVALQTATTAETDLKKEISAQEARSDLRLIIAETPTP